MVIAFAGLALVAATAGSDVPGIAIAATLSWAIGNVVVKRIGPVPMLPLMAWLSLVPPIPALPVSAVLPGPSLIDALRGASFLSLAALLYLGLIATILTYAIWRTCWRAIPPQVSHVLAARACGGILASVLIFGERLEAARIAGILLILAGLAAIVLPARWLGRLRFALDRTRPSR